MTEQEINDHRHTGTDSPQVSYNDLLNLPTGGAGWTFVSYNTASAASSITVSSLNLSTDLQYHFIINCKSSSSGLLTAQVNGASTGSDHAWAIQGVGFTGGSATETNTGDEADSLWTLSHNSGGRSHHCSLFLAFNGNTEIAMWETSSIGNAGGAENFPAINNGAGAFISNDEITSMKFAHNGGTGDWKVWVFKASTS